MAQKQVWIIIEWDDDVITPKVYEDSKPTYDEAWAKAINMAQTYRAEAKSAAGEITMNEDEGRIEVEVLSQYHHFAVQAINCPPTGKDKPKKKDKVTVICYGLGKTYDNAEKAIKFYTDAVHGCDPNSSECSRYNYILDKLRSGAKMIDADLGC